MGRCIKNERSPLLVQNEVRADIFSGSLAVNSFNQESRDSILKTCLYLLPVEFRV